MSKKPVKSKSKAKKSVPKKPKVGTVKLALESRFVPDESQVDPYELPLDGDPDDALDDGLDGGLGFGDGDDDKDNLIDALVKENGWLRDRANVLESAVEQEAVNAAVSNTERHRFRTALELFGRHLDTCDVNKFNWWRASKPCSCGLAVYLEPPK